MLMAAGLGTRLKPFTDRVPKPLLPLMGVPMAQYAVDFLAQAGVKRIVANVHHLAAKAREGLDALDRGDAELVISDESDLLLGSAGGLRKALPHMQGQPFFLINGDVLCEVDLRALAKRHFELREKHGVTLTLTVYPTGPRGGAYREIKVDPSSGLIRGFGEVVPNHPFFAGVAVIDPEALVNVPAEGPAEFLPTILKPAIEARKAGAFNASGEWHDIGSPDLWLQAHLSMIEALEADRLPAVWRKRVESVNQRLDRGIWVNRQDAGKPRSLKAPAYASAYDGESAGPNAVIYGSAPVGGLKSNSISYEGVQFSR